jgi:small subunit ribosomal protein S8
MVMTDPIADLLTRLRNAAAVGHTEVRLPASRVKQAIAKVLAQESYLTSVKIDDGVLVLELAQVDGKPRLQGAKRISKPGRRMYAGKDRLPSVRRGIGTAVVSTSQGVMTASDAKRRKLGGELLLEVY